MSALRVMVALGAATILAVHAEHLGLCDLEYCSCRSEDHNVWHIVNCSLPPDKNLFIMEGDIPEETTDLVILGGRSVTFGHNSMTSLRDPRQIYVTETGVVHVKKFAAVDLSVLNFYFEVDICQFLRFDTHSFYQLSGPLSVDVRNCIQVSTASYAFSWLLKMNVDNIEKLQLYDNSFALDPTSGNVGEHGPSMVIQLSNINMAEIPAFTFASSAAKILFNNVKITEIQSGAFSANTYNTVIALNCSIENIQEDAFSPRSLIHTLNFYGTKINRLSSKALQSAVGKFNMSHNTFEHIEAGAINITVAVVEMEGNIFHDISDGGIELSSWTRLSMKRNSFDELSSTAITAIDHGNPAQLIHEFVFLENEIETARPGSLKFIGQINKLTLVKNIYRSNFYGQSCNCNVSQWLADTLQVDSVEPFAVESFCTVDEFFARCFNVPEQNIALNKFVEGVCRDDTSIHCESYRSGNGTEIKNPRFPHRNKEEGLSSRNAKVIGIVIVTCLGCALLAMLISLVRWSRRKGYCQSFYARICSCRSGNGIDSARSLSRLSVHEYTERHCLNHGLVSKRDIPQETKIEDDIIPTTNKTTQTLPEELTKELLDNLKQKLDNPDNYVEAREMIEHLYELTKMEESDNGANISRNSCENIYELPYQNTTPRVNRNNKEMVSVGTRAPSLDKLLPLSPYHRRTALAHEYFEPRDLAIHLYSEIAQGSTVLGPVPDVVAEPRPRGPYLQALLKQSCPSSVNAGLVPSIPTGTNSIKSSSSSKMVNRPLPEKPVAGKERGAGPRLG